MNVPENADVIHECLLTQNFNLKKFVFVMKEGNSFENYHQVDAVISIKYRTH